jgi:Secretion system C-terminal sorting domain
MKKLNILFLVLCATLFTSKINAQNAVVPNGGFEKWTTLAPGFPSSPEGWLSSDELAFAFSNGKTNTASISKTADKKSGTSAVVLKRDVFSDATTGAKDTVIGTMLTASLLGLFEDGTLGFPSKTRPSALTGFYKFVNPDKDTAQIAFIASKYNTTIKKTEEVGGAEFFITAPASVFTPFTVPIVYDSKLKGIDTLGIIIACSTDEVKSLKTVLTIDDLGLTYPVGTDEFETVPISIYPNPAFEYAYFDFSAIPAAKNIELFDIQGRLVNTSIIENSLFQLSLSDFSTGTFVYKVTDEKHNLIKTGKLVVGK